MTWELVAQIAVTGIGALVGLGIALGGIWLIDRIGGRW